MIAMEYMDWFLYLLNKSVGWETDGIYDDLFLYVISESLG